jgi:hypothetical protein
MAKKVKKKPSLKDKFDAAYVKMKNEKTKQKSGGCSCGGKGCSQCDCG